MIDLKTIQAEIKTIDKEFYDMIYSSILTVKTMQIYLKQKNNQSAISSKPHSTVIKQSDEADEWEQKLPDVSHIPTYAEWETSKKTTSMMVNGEEITFI